MNHKNNPLPEAVEKEIASLCLNHMAEFMDWDEPDNRINMANAKLAGESYREAATTFYQKGLEQGLAQGRAEAWQDAIAWLRNESAGVLAHNLTADLIRLGVLK